MIARAEPVPVVPRIVAIDPGSEESGVVVLDPAISEPVVFAAKMPNDEARASLVSRILHPAEPPAVSLAGPHVLVVETMQPRGQPMYRQGMAALVWVGRFVECWGGEFGYLTRDAVKAHLIPRAFGNTKDSHVRAALVERFGGTDVALERQRTCPRCKGKGHVARSIDDCSECHGLGKVGADGPLRGVKADAWAALAVAVAWSDGLRARDEEKLETTKDPR